LQHLVYKANLMIIILSNELTKR